MMANGARNVTEQTYKPLLSITHTPCVLAHSRTPVYVKLIIFVYGFSNEFVNEHFLPAMNANLALSREHGAKSGRRYRHQATEADFWFWLAHYYFAYHLIAPTEFRTRITNLQSALAGTTGIQRYKKLNAAIHFPLETLKKLFVQFNTIVCRLVHHGSAVTIDETLIEYFGRDAKDAGIRRYIPEKPHSKGLMQ